MPNTDDATPNPKSSDGNNPPKDSGADSGDDKPKGDQRQSVEDLARQRLQGMVDQNLHLMREGRYTEMDTKVVELLSEYTTLTGAQRGQPRPDGVNQTDRYGMPVNPSNPPSNPNPSLEDAGRKALLEQQAGRIRQTVQDEMALEEWGDDARALFAEFPEMTQDEYNSVDILDHNKFPKNYAGYKAWKKAASELRTTLYKQGQSGSSAESEDEGESSGDVDEDRKKAGQRKPAPNVRGEATAVKSLGDAARRTLKGGMSGKDFLEELKKRRTVR